MFAGGITGLSLFRTKLPLPGHSALKLASNFFRAALFERISASPHDERARANDRQGLHLFILGSEPDHCKDEVERLKRCRVEARKEFAIDPL